MIFPVDAVLIASGDILSQRRLPVTTLHPSSLESTLGAFQSSRFRRFSRVSPSSERDHPPILYHACQRPLSLKGVPEIAVTMAGQ